MKRKPVKYLGPKTKKLPKTICVNVGCKRTGIYTLIGWFKSES
jgi:hypothetical protein